MADKKSFVTVAPTQISLLLSLFAGEARADRTAINIDIEGY